MALFKKKGPEMVEREDGLIDYDVYVMSRNEKIVNTIVAAVAIFAVGCVFYAPASHFRTNWFLPALLSLFAFKWPKMRTRQIIDKRKNDLNVQFKDLLYALSSSLSAGRSVESGLKEALRDLTIIYPDPNTNIMLEVAYIVRGLEMNETVEDMFGQFAERAHMEDIENFIDIFRTCKRSGGDLNSVIRSTSQTIGEKIEIQQEIATMIAGKKFEFKALMVMPVALLLLLTYTSGGYMDPVFELMPPVGPLVMTIAIGLFAVAYFIGTKIMKIEV